MDRRERYNARKCSPRAAASFNPLPAANSRRPFRFLRCREIRCSRASSELGSPAAVAEGDRWTLRVYGRYTKLLLSVGLLLFVALCLSIYFNVRK